MQSGLNDYVLPEDFGHDRLNPWHDGIDIATTARAARRMVAGSLYFFIDACREKAKGQAVSVHDFARDFAPIEHQVDNINGQQVRSAFMFP